MRYFTILLFTSFISLGSSAQEDLTGTWEGAGGGAAYAKLCIIRYNNTYIGFTYDKGMGHCKCHFIGEYDHGKKKLKGMNKGVIEKSFFHSQSRYNLNYIVIDGKEYLRGTVAPKTVVMGIPSFISYTRTSSQVDTTDYMLTWLKENIPVNPIIPGSEPALVAADSIILQKNKRITDTLSVINTNAKELLIKVMDNGIIDGDTVSIIHNGRVIAERISVKAIPHEIKIPMSNENDRQEIVLVAHNLGSISPNTALILIETPSKQYRLTASTDLSKNAMIIFNYKE